MTRTQFLEFRKNHKGFPQIPDGPVDTVTWYDAAEYCNWLSEKEGVPKDQWCYVPNKAGKPYAQGMRIAPDWKKRTGYRLPTEAEWEFSCRAGARTNYSCGDFDELVGHYGWHSGNSLGKPHPVATLKANDLGLFDMHGNAWEWCQDWISPGFQPQGKEPKESKDPYLLHDRQGRVLRGGSFFNLPLILRSSYRTGIQPPSRAVLNGFRAARTVRGGGEEWKKVQKQVEGRAMDSTRLWPKPWKHRPMHTTSPTLLEKLREPNQGQAWGRFVELYTPLLLAWARRIGLQPQDAADLVQDVFATLVTQLPKFQYDPEKKNFRGWLRTVCFNKWRDRGRLKQHRMASADSSELNALPSGRRGGGVLGPRARSASRPAGVEKLAGIAWQVHNADRADLLGAGGEQPPAAEVARHFGVTENAVYIAKVRVLRRLREELGEFFE